MPECLQHSDRVSGNEEPMTEFDTNSDEGIVDNRCGVRSDDIEIGTDTVGTSRVYRTFVRDNVADREWAGRRYVADDECPFATAIATEVAA